MKRTREELIEMARKFNTTIPFRNRVEMSDMVAVLMADFALEVLQQQESDTFRVRALRKRGTDDWYDFDGYVRRYPMLIDPNTSFNECRDVMTFGAPEDMELVEIECRVVKTIEP